MTLKKKLAIALVLVMLVFTGFAVVAFYFDGAVFIFGGLTVGLIVIISAFVWLISSAGVGLAQLARHAQCKQGNDELTGLTARFNEMSDALEAAKIAVSSADSTIADHEANIKKAAQRLEKFATGEFSVNMNYGQQSHINTTILVLSRTLVAIINDLQGVAIAMAAGDFKRRIAIEKYSGCLTGYYMAWLE